MLRIDAHQHFWKYDTVRDGWITDEMSVIRNDFLPEHLRSLLRQNGMDGCVSVQADQSKEETDFLLQQAKAHDFIKGVVGWVDLQSATLEERLEYYSGFKKLKGFRHILQAEHQRFFMLRPGFKQGIALLKRFSFTYDILIFPDQLSYTKELVEAFPSQLFVIDHLAKPDIRQRQGLEEWKKGICVLAEHENVYCKVSGMVTEADWKNWSRADLLPYLDVVVEAFGIERLMFGSDWPVCLLAVSYEKWMECVKSYFSSFTSHEQQLVFGGNAVKFYNL